MNPGRFVKNVLIAGDIFLNSLLFGRKVQTISERAAEARDKGKTWGKVLCKALDIPDKDHCTKSNGPG